MVSNVNWRKIVKKGKLMKKFYEKFSTLFDHIVAIKEAEKRGDVTL